MGGKFQSQFVHGVPSYADMKQLVACGEGDEIPWSKEEQKLKFYWSEESRERMTEEIQRLDRLNLEEVENERWNVTLRWCRKHFGPQCPHFLKPHTLTSSTHFTHHSNSHTQILTHHSNSHIHVHHIHILTQYSHTYTYSHTHILKSLHSSLKLTHSHPHKGSDLRASLLGICVAGAALQVLQGA